MASAAALSAGCSARGVYDGIQQQESAKNPPVTGQPAQRRPTYDEYQTERRKAATPDDR